MTPTPQHLAIACEIYRLTPNNKITPDELYGSIQDYYFFKRDEVLKSIEHLSKWGFLECGLVGDNNRSFCISEQDKDYFDQAALWSVALSYEKLGYFEEAERIFLKISEQKAFYSEVATQKINQNQEKIHNKP